MPFEGNSTNAMLDYSGYGNNATYNNATWNDTMGYNRTGTYKFNGINQYLDINSTTLNTITNQITITAWVNKTTDGYVLSKNNISSSGSQYGLFTSTRVQCYLNGAIRAQGAVGDFQNGVWTHVACTWNGTTVIAYVNGNITGTGSYSIPPSIIS